MCPPFDTEKAANSVCIVEFIIVAIAFSVAETPVSLLRIKTLLRVFSFPPSSLNSLIISGGCVFA